MSKRLTTAPQVVIPEKLQAHFSAFAAAALPFEVGGLLRLEHDKDKNTFTAIDFHIFPQSVEEDYFELDGIAVAQFMMQLHVEKRSDEIPQWCSLIHSHPQMTPFMSRPDRENIMRLAGEGFAFSVIFSAFEDPRENLIAIHYAQGAPLKLVVNCASVQRSRIGIESLSDETLIEIENQAAERCGLEIEPGSLQFVKDFAVNNPLPVHAITAPLPSARNGSFPNFDLSYVLLDNECLLLERVIKYCEEDAAYELDTDARDIMLRVIDEGEIVPHSIEADHFQSALTNFLAQPYLSEPKHNDLLDDLENLQVALLEA